MKKALRVGAVVLVVAAVVSQVGSIEARPQYKKAFEKKYPEVVKAQEGGRITCHVCHEGNSKKNRNIYGKTLAKLLAAKNVRDPKKIDKALTKAEKEKSAIEGKTFGDLLKEKKLPASKE